MFCLDRFDTQLAQALGESVFEKGLREKVAQENTSVRWELGQLQQQLKVRDGRHGALCTLGGRVSGNPTGHLLSMVMGRELCVGTWSASQLGSWIPTCLNKLNSGWQIDRQTSLVSCSEIALVTCMRSKVPSVRSERFGKE